MRLDGKFPSLKLLLLNILCCVVERLIGWLSVEETGCMGFFFGREVAKPQRSS